MTEPTLVLVPGLRGHVEDHWQTRLAASLPNVVSVPPLGRTRPSLLTRVTMLQRVVAQTPGPVVLVAHSAGCLVTAHWATWYRGGAVVGALLPTNTRFDAPCTTSCVSCGGTNCDGRAPSATSHHWDTLDRW